MEKQHVEFFNGQKMPLLGLGTWQVSLLETLTKINWKLKYMPKFHLSIWSSPQAADPDELEKAMNEALAAGYRHFDTAYNYTNEGMIGKVLNSWLTSGKVKREDLFIVTKVWISLIIQN